MTKVMRKEARHTQRRNDDKRANGGVNKAPKIGLSKRGKDTSRDVMLFI